MKKESMQILACPICKGKLKLAVDEERGEEVVSGSLYCPKCQHSYPIVDTIPNLLPPDLPIKSTGLNEGSKLK